MNKKELPEGWVWKKLGEVCEIKNGKNQSSVVDPNGKYPIYGSAGIMGYAKDYLCNEGCTVVGRKGNINSPIYVPTKFWNVDTAFGLSPLKIINSKLLYFFCLGFNFRQLDTSTTIPSLTKNNLLTIPILLPPLPVQNAIVAKIEEIFSELEHGVAQLKAARAQLKVYRQAVLKWAFEGRLTNVEVVEGELPEGWKWVRLNEISKITGGVTKGKDFKGKETIHLPYLRVANVQDGYLDLKEIKTIEVLPSDREKYKLRLGDILYTEGGDKDKLGRGCIWTNEIEECIHQNHIFRARPHLEQVSSKYVAYFSQTKLAKNYFFKHGKQTTNLASINLTILSNLPLPFPPLPEQHRIVSEIERRLSECDRMEEVIAGSLRQAEVLRQGVLKRAFEGRLV